MPAMKGKRRRRSRKREALVFQHLEMVSRSLLDEHPDVVKRFIGKNAGVYALYRRDKLYYVGLASKLSTRLKAHKKNRHGQSWDRFSIYLTIKDQHLREIECLLLQIAQPPGNKLGGKPMGSKDMRNNISRDVRQKLRAKASALFGPPIRDAKKANKGNDSSPLRKLLPAGVRLRGTRKNKAYTARVRRDGKVVYAGRAYDSLSAAATAALRRRAHGWGFWRVQRGKGNWVRLNIARRAGTPIFPP